MNFDNDTPIDTVMGELLAFVILFEKKLEHLKCKVAGNEQFHTRIAFQTLDIFKRNEITLDSLSSYFRNVSADESQISCQLFLRKYSRNGALTYDEFLKLVTPKGNKTLAQRMMIRTYPKGALLDEYLQRYLQEILSLYLKMTSITENLRIMIQKNQSLTHLDLIQFFQMRITTPDNLFYFLQRCAEKGEIYDLTPLDSIYLTYHVQSGNDLEDFTEVDIKEILCPLDMNNFQKYMTKQTMYKQSSLPQEFNQTLFNTQNRTQSANFLGKTYQKKSVRPNPKPATTKQVNEVRENREPSRLEVDQYLIGFARQQPSVPERNSYSVSSYGPMYIDNFAQSQANSRLQLNDFLGRNFSNRPQQEVFQDQLNSNGSNISVSRGSAFDRS